MPQELAADLVLNVSPTEEMSRRDSAAFANKTLVLVVIAGSVREAKRAEAA